MPFFFICIDRGARRAHALLRAGCGLGGIVAADLPVTLDESGFAFVDPEMP